MSNDTGTPRPGLADEALSDYILRHIDPEGSYLHALYRDTNLRLLYPRMASGHLQGRLLKMLVRMVRPRQVLEIGTYSGYSALCIAEGLEPGATLHTIEVNDEQEDFTRPWLLPRLAPGGYLLADNTLWDGHVLEPHPADRQTLGIQAFNDRVAQDERVEKVILPLRDGLTIIRKK